MNNLIRSILRNAAMLQAIEYVLLAHGIRLDEATELPDTEKCTPYTKWLDWEFTGHNGWHLKIRLYLADSSTDVSVTLESADNPLVRQDLRFGEDTQFWSLTMDNGDEDSEPEFVRIPVMDEPRLRDLWEGADEGEIDFHTGLIMVGHMLRIFKTGQDLYEILSEY